MKKTNSETLRDLPPHQRWKQQQFPAPAVVALIRRTTTAGPEAPPVSRYLLIKRNGEPYSGFWALVGGKWEFGETLPQAIVREVKEETGLEASFVAVRGIVSERVLEKQTGAHFLLFICELLANEGRAEEQKEGALDWFTNTEIAELHDSKAIIPSDFSIINSFSESQTIIPHIEAEMLAANDDQGRIYFQLLQYKYI